MKILSCFDGISCGQIALNRANINYSDYCASEIDKNAIKVTQANYPNTIQLGDINQWKSWNIPNVDLLFGGSPCQGFSFAGKQLNFEDVRSKLFFTFVDILNYYKPRYFLLENVRMKKEYQDVITKYLGVEPIIINSSLMSAQNRKRLYWTNIPNVIRPQDKNIMLKDVLKEHYDGIWVWPRGGNPGGVQGYKGKAPSITTSSWQHNFLISQNGINRKFTPIECERLQTIPDNYTSCLSDNQRFKCLGNAWTVDVIAHILSFI